MSAGVCIMNKNAVALAADSAVTVGNHLAIHNTANKLFALSKVAPIGAVMYSNAVLMHIPVENVMKLFKKYLSNKTFNSLDDYVQEFFRFMIENKQLFHFDRNERQLILDICSDFLRGMMGDYQLLINRRKDELKADLDEDELKIIQEENIKKTIEFINNLKPREGESLTQYIYDKYYNDIRKCIEQNISFAISTNYDEFIFKLCSIFDKQFFRSGYTGIAFVGYGDMDIFPKMIHIHIAGIINDTVYYAVQDEQCISESNPSTISTFAQTDVMQTFLFGINSGFINYTSEEIRNQIVSCINSIDDSYFTGDSRSLIQQRLLSATNTVIQRIIQKAQAQYLYPITQSIITLPIEELALLAESMINITSLRRRVALDSNIGTVGGPVDVAIISKCDGFVWIKRKHYFSKEYNPQFFYSHYMMQGSDNIE